MSLIGKLLGINLPAWIVEVVAAVAIVGAGLGWFAHHERGIELAKLQKSSAELVDKAKKDIAAETAQHAADNAANEGKLHEALQANAAAGSALDQRVREFDAYRASHPDVPRPACGPTAASSGGDSPPAFADIAVRLAERGNELAGSNGELAAALQACQRDRDSLTGLPK